MEYMAKTSDDKQVLRIALLGGRTAGPIVPLLAVREYILGQRPQAYFIIMDVGGSVGQLLAKHHSIPFYRIQAGKFRRYFSLKTILAPFLVVVGFVQALYILRRQRITHVIGAGGFAQVPVIWAALVLRLARHIHQQDVVPTLANSLCAPAARTISVTFPSSLRDFPAGSGLFVNERDTKISLAGNPCRSGLLKASRAEAQKFFKLEKSWPTVFILGGGSGAQGINSLVREALPELCRTVQILHSTGKGKGQGAEYPRYHAFEFVNRADLAYAAADIVIARAGISTLTELSNLGKAGIIIPMPGSHQEANAQLLFEQDAAIVLDQGETSAAGLVRVVRKLLFDFPLQEKLRQNVRKIMPHDAAKTIAHIMLQQ